MPRRAADGRAPSWDALYEAAGAQSGYFTAKQAAAAGYSPQLLRYYLREGRVERWARGMFRLAHFPPSEHEELVPTFLWSGGVGVFGRETALAIHELSDVLPSKQHLLLPASWSKRRQTAPRGVRLYFVDVANFGRRWHGAVLVTTPLRTVRDCIFMHVNPELVSSKRSRKAFAASCSRARRSAPARRGGREVGDARAIRAGARGANRTHARARGVGRWVNERSAGPRSSSPSSTHYVNCPTTCWTSSGSSEPVGDRAARREGVHPSPGSAPGR